MSGPEDSQPKVSGQHVEITIVVQKFVVVHQAAGADQHVDGLANGDAATAESSIIRGGLQRDVATSHFQELKRLEQVHCSLGVAFGGEALQQFGEDQVSDGQHSLAEQRVQQAGLRCGQSVEVIDPDGGVDDDHFRSSVATHCVQIAGPLQLAACAADPLLTLQLDHQAQAVFDRFAFGPGTAQLHCFCDQMVVDDDVRTHCRRASVMCMKG